MKKFLIPAIIAVVVIGCVVGVVVAISNNNNNPTPETYSVRFIDENGHVLTTQYLEEGETPYYNYTVNDTDDYYCTFEGWSTSASGSVLSSLPPATANAKYYAIVSKIKKEKIDPTVTYTIKFFDENGKLLDTQTVSKGEMPSYSYSVNDTAEWDYTFEGWATSSNGSPLSRLPAANSDANYYAIVSRVKQVYTVSFEMNGAAAIEAQRVEYGDTPVKPANPKYSGHRFIGWFSDSKGKTEFDWTAPIHSNVTVYAMWNETIDISQYLSALLESYKMSPYSFIPEAMQPGYSKNAVDTDDFITDYSKFVNVSDIVCGGFGEQWNMVIENINESTVFHNVLSTVDSLASSSIVAFNNYIDSNPADTAHYNFKYGTYNITINFDGDILYYVVDFTANIPVLGSQTVQLALKLDINSGEKTSRIQIGDANALVYTISENSYTFAIKYLGVRRAYFSVDRKRDGSVEGHIYEYLTAAGIEIESAADFYINDDYTTVVGNKANGMIAFTGTISEVYNTKTGKLIGYDVEEVEETVSSLTFNTLWFDLSTFKGFKSIKYVEKTDEEAAHFYLNGSKTAWESKKVGGLGLKMYSRRFDIEFRTQYFYSYNEVTEKYEKIAVEVPMLFVQEEYYDDLVSDVKKTNNITIENTMSTKDFNKILTSYETYLPIFKTNKKNFNSSVIVELIGSKIVF